jgi:hypothetical protein
MSRSPVLLRLALAQSSHLPAHRSGGEEAPLRELAKLGILDRQKNPLERHPSLHRELDKGANVGEERPGSLVSLVRLVNVVVNFLEERRTVLLDRFDAGGELLEPVLRTRRLFAGALAPRTPGVFGQLMH